MSFLPINGKKLHVTHLFKVIPILNIYVKTLMAHLVIGTKWWECNM